MIKTSCAMCLFAKFDENGVQNGCEMGRLEKYKERNLATLSDQSYMINSFCKTCVRKDQPGLLDLTPQAMREIIRVNAIFIINGLEKDYWPLLKKLLKQKLMPSKVVVVVKEFKEVDRYKEYLKRYTDKESNLLIKMYYDRNPDFYACVNEAMSKYKAEFYTILDADTPINDDYLHQIDVRINDDMHPLVAVFSDGEYRNSFSTQLHRIAGGNTIARGNTPKKTLKEKVEELDPQHVQEGNIWYESM